MSGLGPLSVALFWKATMIRIFFAVIFSFVMMTGHVFAQVTQGDDAPLRFGRFMFEGKIYYGFLATGGVHQLDRSFFEPEVQRTGVVFPLDKIKLLAPVVPSKIIGVAENYKNRKNKKAKRIKGQLIKGKRMQIFAKLPSALITTGEKILVPKGSTNLHFEGEMVIVMGEKARQLSIKQAADAIFGVTVGNDITERSFAGERFDSLRSKGSDTFAPIGSWIVPGLSYDRLGLVTKLNGKVVQKFSTRKMRYSTAEIVSRISQYITLEPGDLIYTGTSGKTRAMKKGDVVEVLLEGVGVLKNMVGE